MGLGFTQGGGENNYERMKLKVNDELKKHFRPEFLNRIDDIIVFHQLTQQEIIEMVDLMIGQVSKQLAAKDMAMELSEQAKSLLAKRGFDPVLGARPLRRTIQREIEDALSEKILFDEVGPGRSRHRRRRRLGRRGCRRERQVHLRRTAEGGLHRRGGPGGHRSRITRTTPTKPPTGVSGRRLWRRIRTALDGQRNLV